MRVLKPSVMLALPYGEFGKTYWEPMIFANKAASAAHVIGTVQN